MIPETNASPQNEPPEVEKAIIALLNSIPDRWAEFDPDQLTDAETRAQFWLVGAGLVERRFSLRVHVINHPKIVDLRLRATGEYGIVEALQGFWRKAIAIWGEDLFKSIDDRLPATSRFHLDRIKPEYWRLTVQGCVARADLSTADRLIVLDFVLKRNFYFLRSSVRGEGFLEEFEESDAQPGSQSVNARVTNWDEGISLFLAAMHPSDPKPTTSEQPDEHEDESPADQYAKPGDPIPDRFFTEIGPNRHPNGPLEGGLSELAWAVDPRPGREPRSRHLADLHDKRVWVERITRNRCRVYFLTLREFKLAQQHLDAFRQNPRSWAEGGKDS